MNLKNTLLNYNKIDMREYFDDQTYIIKDFTENIYSIPDEYYKDKYYDNHICNDNERLETLAYKYYDDQSLWDLIMIYNKMSSPLLLPKSWDFVVDRAEIRYNEWAILYAEGKPDWFLDNKKKYFTKISELENEKFRTIKLLDKDYIRRLKREISDGFRIKS